MPYMNSIKYNNIEQYDNIQICDIFIKIYSQQQDILI